MNVAHCMSRDVQVAAPNQSLREVAQMMKKCDAGFIPVGENDRLIGMITDRDIVVRAVAEGRDPDTKVSDAMSQEVLYCFDDEEIDVVSGQMAELKVRRLPVLNRDKRLVGVVSLGDLAQSDDLASGLALSEIATPGGRHAS
jgi:CBS domain-containing protein